MLDSTELSFGNLDSFLERKKESFYKGQISFSPTKPSLQKFYSQKFTIYLPEKAFEIKKPNEALERKKTR